MTRFITRPEYDAFLAGIESRKNYLSLKLKAETKIQSGEWVIVDVPHQAVSQEVPA